MTTGKLEILIKKFEKAADEFRGLEFNTSVLYNQDMDSEFRYNHVPDKCVPFKDGYFCEKHAWLIKCWPEHNKPSRVEETHKPFVNENGDEFAAYLIKPRGVTWNSDLAITTLDSLCNEMFGCLAEIEENGISLWNNQKSFGCEETQELKQSLYRTDLSKTCRSLIVMMLLRRTKKIAIGTDFIRAKPEQSYCQKSEDVFLGFAILCAELIDSIKIQCKKREAPPEEDQLNPGITNPTEKPELTDTESNIIEALGKQTIIGEVLAVKAGYPYNSNFKATLSALRKRGIIGNKSPGYFLEPEYRYLLDKPD